MHQQLIFNSRLCLYSYVFIFACLYRYACPVVCVELCMYSRTETLGGLADGPPNLRFGGGRPMYPSPNISRSSVIGCVTKYEVTIIEELFLIFCSEIEVFRQEKGHIYMLSDFRQ